MGGQREDRTGRAIRWTLGGVAIAVGAVFMLVPFIPLGYILIIAGLFFLSPVIPAFGRWLDRLEEKDRKGRVRRARKRASDVEKGVQRRIEKTQKQR